MPVIHKQALAEQDLVNIWLYTWHEWGEAQADAYLDELERAMQLLVEQPSLGRLREAFTPAVRILNHAHHMLVYQIIQGGIRIIRVLHKNMDIDIQLDVSP